MLGTAIGSTSPCYLVRGGELLLYRTLSMGDSGRSRGLAASLVPSCRHRRSTTHGNHVSPHRLAAPNVLVVRDPPRAQRRAFVPPGTLRAGGQLHTLPQEELQEWTLNS